MIWIVCWIVAAALTAAFSVFVWAGGNLSRGSAIAISIYCLLLWPLAIIVMLYLGAVDGGMREWLDEPLLKKRT